MDQEKIIEHIAMRLRILNDEGAIRAAYMVVEHFYKLHMLTRKE